MDLSLDHDPEVNLKEGSVNFEEIVEIGTLTSTDSVRKPGIAET